MGMPIEEALSRRFDSIDKCRERVIAANATTPALNLTFTLTLPQCYEYCGVGYGTYDIWSVVSALSSWVIPLFLLLGNVTYARISSSIHEKGKFTLGPLGNWIAVISHLLANPIDFLWSLSHKLHVGSEIRNRCYDIKGLLPSEQKYLSAIAFTLEDFQDGRHVETLLRPLEEESDRLVHVNALRDILGPTARDLADSRKHNKLHSTLAILVYGKEVFEALINAQLDGSFPYHMPHTLALRQIYYWLFLAVILSAATGCFANQWTSHAILERFLVQRHIALQRSGHAEMNRREPPEGRVPPEMEGRHDAIELLDPREAAHRDGDISLLPLEPWNGGNYCWRYPKNGGPGRNPFLLSLVVMAVLLPVTSAFLISWYTPTVGLGDRGIMELSFAGLWFFNWGITYVASKYWHGWRLFAIAMWWNLFWALATLIVLFTAFQGWFNSCQSWSAYYSRGAAGAVLDLNMKVTEEDDIFTFYLPMILGSLIIQLLLAVMIILPNKNILKCLDWTSKENYEFWKRTHR